MLIQALAFYMFAGILALSALAVISVRSPVHSVLFLILSFFTSAGLFTLLGAEFIAFLMVIVYVGAVAVLFLFVVMMLNIDFAHLRKGAMQYVPVGIGIGGVLLVELAMLFSTWESVPDVAKNIAVPIRSDVENTRALGEVLYTDYVFVFQTSGMILFVAMIGAIVLTHRTRSGVRRQVISDQQARRVEDVLEIRKVTPKTGA